jgi:rhamnosyltransferase
MRHRIAAIIVAYRPDRELLLQLVQAIAGDVEIIYLFLNSPPAPSLIEDCAAASAPARLGVLGDGTNVGLGRAYNEAARAARGAGCDLLLLLDQDSLPLPGMATRLAAAMLDAADRRPGMIAAVGPLAVLPFPSRRGGVDVNPAAVPAPRTGLPALTEVAFLMSSGSLIDLDAFARIGPFREDFFIDGIDIEWCFRARAGGMRCWLARCEPMAHRLGSGSPARLPLNIRLTRQPPDRLFTFARNQTAMMRLAHVPLWWKARVSAVMALRLIVSLVIGRGGTDALAILRGIGAGLRQRLGAPPSSGCRTSAPGAIS